MSWSRRLATLLPLPWCGVAGLGLVVVLALGCGLATAHHPSYSVLEHYVSQLANPKYAGHHYFNGALLLGGGLTLVFSPALAALVGGGHGRRATVLAAVAGVSMSLVGVFPLTVPVLHFGCAAALFAAAIFATLFAGLGMRQRARTDGGRRQALVGKLLIGVFVFMIVMTVVGFVITGFAMGKVQATEPAAVLKELPRYQSFVVAGVRVNPVSLQEWVFLVVAMGLVAGTSVLCFRRAARPTESV